MSIQRNSQPVALVWSPQTAMLPFNPVLTPGQAYMPITPYVTTPLPYFTFSPVAASMNGSCAQTSNSPAMGYQPQGEAPAPVQPLSLAQSQTQGQTTSAPQEIPSAPMLLPVPGSTKRGKLRKRKAPSLDTPDAVQPAPETQKPALTPKDDSNNKMSVKNLLGEPSTPRTKVRRLHSPPPQTTLLLSPPKEHIFEVIKEQPQAIINSPEVVAEPNSIALQSPSTSDREHSLGDESEEDSPRTFMVTLKLRSHKRQALTSELPGFDPFEDKALIGILLEDSADPIEVDSGFQCPSCGKKFKFRKHCRRHMVNHTGQKPFSCDRCKRTYARKDTCQRHSLRCRNPPPSL